MGDGIGFNTRAIDRSMKRLRKIAPTIDQEMPKAVLKSAEEMATVAKSLAPKDSGDYAESINAKPVLGEVSGAVLISGNKLAGTSKVGSAAAGVFASWIWYFLEFGTVKTDAQPHMLPTFRLLKKRAIGRMRRAMTKSIKKAMRG